MDLTLGELLGRLRAYRAYLAVVAVVLFLAVVLPGDAPVDAPSQVASGSPAASAGGAPAATGGGSATAGGAAVGGQAGASVRGAGSGGAATAGAGATSGTVDGPSPPGVTGDGGFVVETTAPEDCDPATGRLALPTSGSVAYPPNCVALWPGGDNGGATWNGVTGDTITIAIYEAQENEQAAAITSAAGASDDTSDEEDDANRDKVVEALSAHYETYGRNVEWVVVHGSGPSDDDAAAKADAIRVATEIKAFASLGDPSQAAGATSGGTNAYIDELAARGVLCVACTQTQPQRNFEKWAPHTWGQRISADQLYLHVAEYVGKGLGTSNAQWAGDPVMQQQQRTYGLLQYNTPDNSYGGSADFLADSLAPYGLRLAEVAEYYLDLAAGQEIARTVVAKMKDAGVNTLICYCDPLMPIFFTQEATKQSFFPEWIVTGSLLTDTALFGRLYDQLQWSHAHGVSLLPARVDPDALEAEQNLVEWHFGEELSSYPDLYGFSMLFTGIHLAGPVLDPVGFRDGMFSFAPATGYLTRVAMAYGTVTTPWNDYHALDDTTEIWWDESAQGPDELGAEASGLYRYVHAGRRYLIGERSGPSRAFDPEGTVLIYPERPPEDATPQYEHTDNHPRGG